MWAGFARGGGDYGDVATRFSTLIDMCTHTDRLAHSFLVSLSVCVCAYVFLCVCVYLPLILCVLPVVSGVSLRRRKRSDMCIMSVCLPLSLLSFLSLHTRSCVCSLSLTDRSLLLPSSLFLLQVDSMTFWAFQGWLVPDDMKRRDFNNPTVLTVARAVPFFGLAYYLLVRPPLPDTQA